MDAPRISLRTLLVLLILLPPLLAWLWFTWSPARSEPAIEDDPYEIIVDDYAPDVLPPQRP